MKRPLKSSTWVTAIGCVGLWATAGLGTAAAQPDLAPVINTTCTYPQAVAALGAHDPQAASQLAGAPMAQAWLQQFLAAPADKRVVLAQQVQQLPGAQQYMGLVLTIAQNCGSY